MNRAMHQAARVNFAARSNRDDIVVLIDDVE
jgi:hypothetical protein